MTDSPAESVNTLLIASVGGTCEPVVQTLLRWRPVRAVFVPTRETRHFIEPICESARAAGFVLPDANRDECMLPSGENLTACIHALRRLDGFVADWLRRGQGFRLAVDYTGGTKTISGALVLWARRWPCIFSYVGGKARTRDGVGVVITGQEQVVACSNPWNALGYQAAEQACAAFDSGRFGTAERILEDTRVRVDEQRVKQEMTALFSVVNAYSAWDRFDHRAAVNKLAQLNRYENDLRAVLGEQPAAELLELSLEHREFLEKIVNSADATTELVRDLLANALRRAREDRYDDAVARLYRAVEAWAQIRLRDGFGIDTSQVPCDRIPEPLRDRWMPRAASGNLSIGLQDAYELLEALGDPVGSDFRNLDLNGPKSPLAARNRSILAHGWHPISRSDYDALWSKLQALTCIAPDQLPRFPKLSAVAVP